MNAFSNCDICDKTVKSTGLGAHKRLAHDPNYVPPMLGRKREQAWNKGLTKETSDSVKQYADTLKQNLKTGKIIHSGTNKKRTLATKEKISKTMRESNICPVGRKSYYYLHDGKNVRLQSKYEIALAESLDSNNIAWTRPTFFRYIDKNNIERKYFPDFYLPEYDVYLDPKNDYLITKDQHKITSAASRNNIVILILNKNQLTWNAVRTKIQSA